MRKMGFQVEDTGDFVAIWSKDLRIRTRMSSVPDTTPPSFAGSVSFWASIQSYTETAMRHRWGSRL